jgi:hypothetical protein
MAANLYRHRVAQGSDLLDVRTSLTLVGLERRCHYLLGTLHWGVEIDPFAVVVDVTGFDARLLQPAEYRTR